MDYKKLAADIHKNALKKGFWEGEYLEEYNITVPPNMAEKFALIHSEVSEAMECHRIGQILTTIAKTGKPEGLGSELADVIIRVIDMATYLGIDLEKEIYRKHKYNKTRPYKHGKKY